TKRLKRQAISIIGHFIESQTTTTTLPNNPFYPNTWPIDMKLFQFFNSKKRNSHINAPAAARSTTKCLYALAANIRSIIFRCRRKTEQPGLNWQKAYAWLTRSIFSIVGE